LLVVTFGRPEGGGGLVIAAKPSIDRASTVSFQHARYHGTIWVPIILANLKLFSEFQEVERFVETYSVPVAWRTSWSFAPIVPAGSIKNNEEHDMAVDMDMVNGVILELYLAEKNKAARKRARKKESKPKTKKREGKGERYSWRMTSEEEGHESEGGKVEIPESDPAGGGEARAWTCKKNNGRG
jgi:hypothetical protein